MLARLFVPLTLLLSETSAMAAEPPKTQVVHVDIDGLLAPLAKGGAEAERARQSILELDADAVSRIQTKLNDLSHAKTPLVQIAIKAAKDARKDRGDSFDLFAALAEQSGTGNGYEVAIQATALAQALAKIGTQPALRALIEVSDDHGGAYRFEVARLLRAAGDKAIPALIESRRSPSSEVRRWGSHELEAMNKKLPGEAIQTKDNQVLADVLRAFATVHEPDAIAIILSFVNSDRVQVRTAAREALSMYGQDAIWKLREAYTNLTGETKPEGARADEVARDLFAAYDRVRLHEVYGQFELGTRAYKDGKVEEATRAFDTVLAREPMFERRAEMTAAYVARAQAIEDAEPGEALALYRKALRLDPGGARANSTKGAIAYLEGKDLLARGIADVSTFKKALELDPGHSKAMAELDRLETDAAERTSRMRRWAAAAAILLLATCGIVMFGRPSRRAAA